MAEPMTPATLGPMACISRKLEGLAFWPSRLDTRAAMGTADTPAEPMRGLTLPLYRAPLLPKDDWAVPHAFRRNPC